MIVKYYDIVNIFDKIKPPLSGGQNRRVIHFTGQIARG